MQEKHVRRRSLEFLDRDIRILEYVYETRIFADDFLTEALSAKDILGFDENIRFTQPAFDTGVSSSYDISYLDTIKTITFNTSYYFDNYDDPEDPAMEKANVAVIIFHEYAHHIQTLINGGKDSDRARAEDTADYFSGFMLAKFLEHKKLHLDRTKLFENIKKIFKKDLFEKEHRILPENEAEYGKAGVEFFSESLREITGHAIDKFRFDIFKKGFEESGDITNLNEFFLNYKTI